MLGPYSSAKRIVVLVSGSGSNLQAIINECEAGFIHGHVIGVVCNVVDAYALTRAHNHGIATAVVNHKEFASRVEFDRKLAEQVQQFTPDLVVLAGFMRILSAEFVAQFAGKMLNIHPSLLPKYPGLHTHQKVLQNGDATHGASVHFVNTELDGGPVVLQSQINVNSDDTLESLQSRLAITEWYIYALAVKWFCNDSLSLESDSVYFRAPLDYVLSEVNSCECKILLKNRVTKNEKDSQ